MEHRKINNIISINITNSYRLNNLKKLTTFNKLQK